MKKNVRKIIFFEREISPLMDKTGQINKSIFSHLLPLYHWCGPFPSVHLSIVTFNLFLSSRKPFTTPSKKCHFLSCESCLPTSLWGFSGFLNCRLPCLQHQPFASPTSTLTCHQRKVSLLSAKTSTQPSIQEEQSTQIPSCCQVTIF